MLIDSPNPCLECGKTFKAPRKQFNYGRKFCDIKCAGIYHGKEKLKNLIDCLCCGKTFRGRKRKSGVSRGNIYCSSECRQKHRGITRTCLGCGEKFNTYDKRQGKYCSRECYDKNNSAELITHNCFTCGKEITRLKALDMRRDSDPERRRFCTKKCFGLGNRDADNSSFRGNRKAYRGKTWIPQQQKVRKIFTHCRFCEKFVEGQQRHVDHIVPYRMAKLGKSDPNGDRNLWVLCRKCHSSKTQAERFLFNNGIPAFEDTIVNIAKREDIRLQMRDAFKYCGIVKAEGMTKVTLAKTKNKPKESFYLNTLFD